MRRLHSAVALLALACAGACATGMQLEPARASLAQQACEAQCDCLQCSDDQHDKCESDLEVLGENAVEKDCDSEFEDYLECIGDDAECQGAQLDTAMCGTKATAFSACMEAGPASCLTVGNGVCDEPEGNGTCPEGTDIADCAGNSLCPTSNNGVCDEPSGTGLCPPLSDIADCTGGTCPTTYDGTCDEPEGTNTCPEGSDSVDCTPTTSCEYPGDGICDEPEGTGICAEGTDPLDCDGGSSCSTCYEYGYESSALPLCPSSSALWDAVSNCICSYGCPSECASVCSGGSTDSYCDSCVSSYCSAELDACYNDV